MTTPKTRFSYLGLLCGLAGIGGCALDAGPEEHSDPSSLTASSVVKIGPAKARKLQPVTPLSPLGTLSLGGEHRRVEVVGSTAVVASSNGITSVDVANPSAPAVLDQLSFYATSGYAYAYDLALLGSYAYVAASDAGLRIVDLSDPSNLVELGAHAVGHEALGVAVRDTSIGRLAVVTAGSSGTHLVDVTDPANTVKLAKLNAQYGNEPEFLDDDTVVIADGPEGLRVFDIVDATPTWYYPYPKKLQLVGRLTSAFSQAFVLVIDAARQLAFVGNYAASSSSVRIVSLVPTPGVNPLTHDNLPSVATIPLVPNLPAGLARNGAVLYVAAGYGGFEVWDTSIASAPVKIDELALPSLTQHANPTGSPKRLYTVSAGALRIYAHPY